MFREIEGGHRLELKDINCENWLKLRGPKPFSNCPLKPPKNLYRTGYTYCSIYIIYYIL